MTSEYILANSAWKEAFPLKPATEAVEAICEGWKILTEKPRKGFCASIREPVLTKILKTYVEHVIAPQRGLLGFWVAEPIINSIDPNTFEIIEERRNDIVYGWNSDKENIQLVFEFKKMTKQARSRKEYIGDDGLKRFVTGMYSRGQHIALMVGILIDQFNEIVPPLLKDLNQDKTIKELKMCKQSGSSSVIAQPSNLFNAAEFDTTHIRPKGLAPNTGRISVAHLFLDMPTKS